MQVYYKIGPKSSNRPAIERSEVSPSSDTPKTTEAKIERLNGICTETKHLIKLYGLLSLSCAAVIYLIILFSKWISSVSYSPLTKTTRSEFERCLFVVRDYENAIKRKRH